MRICSVRSPPLPYVSLTETGNRLGIVLLITALTTVGLPLTSFAGSSGAWTAVTLVTERSGSAEFACRSQTSMLSGSGPRDEVGQSIHAIVRLSLSAVTTGMIAEPRPPSYVGFWTSKLPPPSRLVATNSDWARFRPVSFHATSTLLPERARLTPCPSLTGLTKLDEKLPPWSVLRSRVICVLEGTATPTVDPSAAMSYPQDCTPVARVWMPNEAPSLVLAASWTVLV